MGLDVGPDSVKTFSDALETTKTVIWNGPMGVFEFEKFAVGTEVILNMSIVFIFSRCFLCPKSCPTMLPNVAAYNIDSLSCFNLLFVDLDSFL